MHLTDTHCHLYLEDFDPDQDLLIEKAQASGISMLLLPNVDNTTTDRMHALCDRHPGYAFPMMGLHPTSVDSGYTTELRKIEAHLSRRTYCAIGEIGIDLYWDKTHLKEQKIAFEEQLQWSIDLDLPVAIHTRNAFAEVFDSIYKVKTKKLTGVFHSFSGNAGELDEIVNNLPGFVLGINGVVTFKNAGLASVIRETEMSRIIFETDAPYLAPVPYRGKRNEPAYIWETVRKVAETYGLSVEKTAEWSQTNVRKLFKSTHCSAN